MRCKITGFHQDERDDWVAELDCHHGQHVRHNPPFTNRPWVETEDGRNEKLGFELDCVRCDRFEWPDDLVFQRRTRTFDEATVPAGLLKDHSTKTGTWGLICIEHGALLYITCHHRQTLTPDQKGIVVPNMLHKVEALGEVLFFVEFYSL